MSPNCIYTLTDPLSPTLSPSSAVMMPENTQEHPDDHEPADDGGIQMVHSLLYLNPLNAELNPICHLVALLGLHHFLHVSRIRVKSLTLRLLMSYIYGAPILDVSRSHTTHHSR